MIPEDLAHRQLPIDPVCRMAVDPVLAASHTVYRGVEYHFCSEGCAEAFRDAPQRYTGRRSHRATLLVSDDARDRTARRLARAYAKGRIDADDLEERTELVWSARTRADLEAVTHDLQVSGPWSLFERFDAALTAISWELAKSFAKSRRLPSTQRFAPERQAFASGTTWSTSIRLELVSRTPS